MNTEDNKKPQQTDDYEFIREQIRERPVNRKKLLRRTLMTAGMAVVFGLVACITFLLLEPVISKGLNADKEVELAVVTPPEEQDTNDEPVNVKISDDEGEKITVQQWIEEGEEGPEEVSVIEVETPIEKMTLSDDAVSKNTAVTNTLEEDYEEEEGVKEAAKAEDVLEEYRQTSRHMYALSQEVAKSLVTVTAISSDTDWLQETYESRSQEVGIIVADNGIELLILTPSAKLKDADSIQVTFNDGTVGQLREKAVDEDTGLGVYAIRLSMIPEKTRTNARNSTVTLGSSYTGSILGNAVMAVGNPLGTPSVCYGFVTSANRRIIKRDASYQLLTTDIEGSSNASGVLANLRGQVVGILTMEYADEESGNLLYAYGISSMRGLIETLTNDEIRPYLGVMIKEIPTDVASAYHIPSGVLVDQVLMDSPAMKAGLTKGDILKGVGEYSISNATEFMSALHGCQAGSMVMVEFARKNGDEYRIIEQMIELGTLDE